jgi:hypothetical protein
MCRMLFGFGRERGGNDLEVSGRSRLNFATIIAFQSYDTCLCCFNGPLVQSSDALAMRDNGRTVRLGEVVSEPGGLYFIFASFPIESHVFSQALFQYSTSGGLQEYTLVDPQYAAIVPPNITDLDAAVFPINAVISALNFFSSNGFGMPLPGTPESKSLDYKSQKVVVIGVAGQTRGNSPSSSHELLELEP